MSSVLGTPEVRAIYHAVETRDLNATERLLETVDPNVRHPMRDCSLLHYAVCDPVEISLVKLLLARGADHDARDSETGGTPLHQLLSVSLPLTEQIAVIDLLIGYGGDLNVIVEDLEENPYTAVDIAVSGWPRDAELLRALLERGGKPGPDARPLPVL
jgi:ankyrin repeat protein